MVGGAVNAGQNLAEGNYLAAAGEAVGVVGGIASFMKACFVAGTPLLLPDGTSKPIEEFVVGDLVLSRSENDVTALIQPRRVAKTFIRVSPILNLHVRGRVIGTTGEHPFWTVEKGWTEAKDLQIGDELIAHDGRRIVVEGVATSGRLATVYNLEVEYDHTYFVGTPAWGWSIWAHNYNPTAARNGKAVTREERWLDLANQPGSKLPKEVIDHIRRTGGKGVSERFGLELAHLPKQAASQGVDYSKALPKYAADHRGIQHRYLQERSSGTTIRIPKSGTMGRGPLSLPPAGALP